MKLDQLRRAAIERGPAGTAKCERGERAGRELRLELSHRWIRGGREAAPAAPAPGCGRSPSPTGRRGAISWRRASSSAAARTVQLGFDADGASSECRLDAARASPARASRWSRAPARARLPAREGDGRSPWPHAVPGARAGDRGRRAPRPSSSTSRDAGDRGAARSPQTPPRLYARPAELRAPRAHRWSDSRVGSSRGRAGTRDRLLRPTAVLLDLDGVLHVEDDPIPGAIEAVAALRDRGLRLRFVTNTTSRPRRDFLRRSRAARDARPGRGVRASCRRALHRRGGAHAPAHA